MTLMPTVMINTDEHESEELTGTVVEQASLYDVSDTERTTLSNINSILSHNDRLFSVLTERVLHNTRINHTSLLDARRVIIS